MNGWLPVVFQRKGKLRSPERGGGGGGGGNCIFYKTGSTVILRASPEFAVFRNETFQGKRR